jgi:hypothetical protein
MSYSIHVWSEVTPPSSQAAEATLIRLGAQRPGQNPKFVELARKLTERYPSASADEDPDDSEVWTDGPVDGRTDRAVYGLGIRLDALDEVLPFVVKTAAD